MATTKNKHKWSINIWKDVQSYKSHQRSQIKLSWANILLYQFGKNLRSLMISSASEDEHHKHFYSVDTNIHKYNHSENFVHALVKINMCNSYDSNFTLKYSLWGIFCPCAPDEMNLKIMNQPQVRMSENLRWVKVSKNTYNMKFKNT